MRKYFVILFVLFNLSLSAQCIIKAGTLSITDMGAYYSIKTGEMPVNTCVPVPDSMSLKVTVICLQNFTNEVSNIPVGGELKYKFKGPVIITCSVLWWKNGVKKSQSCQKNIWITGNKITNCFQKI